MHARALEMLAGRNGPITAAWHALHLTGTGRGPDRMVVPANAEPWLEAYKALGILRGELREHLFAGRRDEVEALSYAIDVVTRFAERARQMHAQGVADAA